jgi:hypothetical protein
MLNDCLTFSVNQLLRHRFFVQREQVQRLWKESIHWKQDRVDARKVEFGVSISAFRDFFVKEHLAFSIVQVEEYKGKECYAALKAFVKANLETSSTHREIMVLCTQIQDGNRIVSHAGTFLRQESATGFVTIKYYDPNENHFFERGDYKIDYKKLFLRFESITVYALHGRLVIDPEEEDRINSKMARIMTGSI